jgi:polyketide biosynthesis enoyl-CoA hydratase PksI
MGTTRLLEHVLSPAVAHELLYTGEPVRGTRFLGRSGFNYILPRAEVRPKALDLARRIAEKPRAALMALKDTLGLPKRQTFETTRTSEALMHQISLAQPGIRRMIEDGYVE